MLTKLQCRVLRYVMEVQEREGYSPSYQEISDAMDLKSKGRVAFIVNGLIERGYLSKMEGKHRALRVRREPGGMFITPDDLLAMMRQMMEGAKVFGEYDEVMDVRVDRALWETIIREVEDRG